MENPDVELASYTIVSRPKSYAEKEKRFMDILNDIRNHPEHHWQQQWHCGTSHCFAGIAQLHARGLPLSTRVGYMFVGSNPEQCATGNWQECDLIFRTHRDYCRITERQAVCWLGISDDDAEELFDSDNKLEDLERMTNKILQAHLDLEQEGT